MPIEEPTPVSTEEDLLGTGLLNQSILKAKANVENISRITKDRVKHRRYAVWFSGFFYVIIIFTFTFLGIRYTTSQDFLKTIFMQISLIQSVIVGAWFGVDLMDTKNTIKSFNGGVN